MLREKCLFLLLIVCMLTGLALGSSIPVDYDGGDEENVTEPDPETYDYDVTDPDEDIEPSLTDQLVGLIESFSGILGNIF